MFGVKLRCNLRSLVRSSADGVTGSLLGKRLMKSVLYTRQTWLGGADTNFGQKIENG